MGQNHDEQVKEEIAANAPDPEEVAEDTLNEEEDELVELNLETGETAPVEQRPPGVVFRTIRQLGQALVDFAEGQTAGETTLEGALDSYKSKERLLKVGFWVALLLLAGAAELVLSFLGLFVLAAYFFYFSLLNLSGTQSTVDRLKQAVMMSSMQGGAPLDPNTDQPGAGQYL